MPFDLARLIPHVDALADYYADHLIPDLHSRASQASALLQEVGQDGLRRAAERKTVRVLATPHEEPAEPHQAPAPIVSYRILASDGSSIAPDLHQTARYAVLHTALAGLAYAPADYWTEHRAHLLFRREEMEISPPGSDEPIPVDGLVVETMRAHQELEALWQGVEHLPVDTQRRPLLALMDSIILWRHRGGGRRHEALGDDFLQRSVLLLTRFEQAGIPLASFGSMPHHREVVNTLTALVCPQERQMACADCGEPQPACAALQGIEDRHLFDFLPEGARSALFQPIYQGDIAWRLPPAARSHDPRLAFFYLNTGPEVARVELPLWSWEAGLLELVHGVLLDQCRPVRAEVAGYPVALTLAHREAMLTTGDRQAVQWLVEEALAHRGLYVAPSAKARMKEM